MYNDFIQTKDKRLPRQFKRIAVWYQFAVLLAALLRIYISIVIKVSLFLIFIGMWKAFMSWLLPIPENIWDKILSLAVVPLYPIILIVYKHYTGELPHIDIALTKYYWTVIFLGIQTCYVIYVAWSFFYNMIIKLQIIKILRPWPLAVILSSLTLFYFLYQRTADLDFWSFIRLLYIKPLVFIGVFRGFDRMEPLIFSAYSYIELFGTFFCYAFIVQNLYILRQALKKRTFFQRIVGGYFKEFVVDTCKEVRTHIKWIPRRVSFYLDENDWMKGNAAQVGFNAMAIPLSAIPTEDDADTSVLKMMILEYVFGLRSQNYYSNEITRILIDIMLLPIMAMYYFCYLLNHYGHDPTVIWIYKLGQKIVSLNTELCAAPGSNKQKWKLLDKLKEIENQCEELQIALQNAENVNLIDVDA